MYKDNCSEDERGSEAVDWERRSDLYGYPMVLNAIGRGKKRAVVFPKAVRDPEAPSESLSSSYGKLIKRVLQDLTPVQRRTFILYHEHLLTVDHIAEIESVARSAIYSRLECMKRRSKYCRASAMVGRLRRKTNQHG